MALLSEHIAHIKSVLSKGAESDNSRYSDRQIYFLLKYLRAELLKQKLDKYHFVSPFNYQTIPCIELEKVDENEGCECYSTGCLILKSKYALPRVIVNRNQLLLKIWTPAGIVVDYATNDEVKRAKYSKTKNSGYTYEIINNYIYVRGNLSLEALKVRAIFTDPLEVNIPGACGDNQTCFDPYTEDFPLDLEMTRALNKMSYEELVGVMSKMKEDMENNSNDEE